MPKIYGNTTATTICLDDYVKNDLSNVSNEEFKKKVNAAFPNGIGGENSNPAEAYIVNADALWKMDTAIDVVLPYEIMGISPSQNSVMEALEMGKQVIMKISEYHYNNHFMFLPVTCVLTDTVVFGGTYYDTFFEVVYRSDNSVTLSYKDLVITEDMADKADIDLNNVSVEIIAKKVNEAFPDGVGSSEKEIYVGTDEPADENVLIWVDTDDDSNSVDLTLLGAAAIDLSNVSTEDFTTKVNEAFPDGVGENVDLSGLAKVDLFNVSDEAFAKKFVSALPDFKDGEDGISATHSWNGTTLTITSASGTSSADLKGDKGATGSNGKSAYEYAQDGGYTGTESNFVTKLAETYTKEEWMFTLEDGSIVTKRVVLS